MDSKIQKRAELSSAVCSSVQVRNKVIDYLGCAVYPFLPSGERFSYLVDFPCSSIVVRDKKKKELSTIELDVRNINAFLMTCRSMYYARHAPEVANVLGVLRAPDFITDNHLGRLSSMDQVLLHKILQRFACNYYDYEFDWPDLEGDPDHRSILLEKSKQLNFMSANWNKLSVEYRRAADAKVLPRLGNEVCVACNKLVEADFHAARRQAPEQALQTLRLAREFIVFPFIPTRNARAFGAALFVFYQRQLEMDSINRYIEAIETNIRLSSALLSPVKRSDF